MIRSRYAYAFALVVFGLIVAFAYGTSPVRRRATTTVPANASPVRTTIRFTSPAAVYTEFRAAVAARDWRREFACYSPKRKAKFIHHIVAMASGLEFEMDLFVKIEAAFARHGLAETDLTNIWPDGEFTVIEPGQEAEAAAAADKWYDDLIDNWERNIYPRIDDPAQLIATLQPLIREADRRQGDFTRVSRCVGTLDGYAYGRLREIKTDGDIADGKIRIKTLRGAFVDAESLSDAATADAAEDQPMPDTPEKPRVELDTESSLYVWLWEAAAQVKAFSDSLRRPRMVFLGLPSGDVALCPEYDGSDPEEEENGWANNGTRTAIMGDVKFRHFDDGWLIDDVDCR